MFAVRINLYHCLKMSRQNSNATVVVVLGATGTGKSKLALEIAAAFKGEIINSDSMQMYKSLDIATNKEKSNEVKHNLINFLDPLSTYNVIDFRDSVVPLVMTLHKNQILPVVVGGTHYYVDSLLWNVLVSSPDTSAAIDKKRFKHCEDFSVDDTHTNASGNSISDDGPTSCTFERAKTESTCSTNSSESSTNSPESSEYFRKRLNEEHLESLSNNELIKLLEKVDPIIASTYHPNNRRKIIRSLEVWSQTGRRHSDIIQEQANEAGVNDLGGSIRYRNAAVIWVTCDQEILDERLDKRVDDMIERGLINELLDFHLHHNEPMLKKFEGVTKDILNRHYSRGIFQCIGLKEFHDYLILRQDENADTQKLENAKEEAIKLMKSRTRKYSRRQLKWIRNRFLKRDRMRIPIYCVDGTDTTKWRENVTEKAREIVGSFLAGKKPAIEPVPVIICEYDTADKSKNVCQECDRTFIGIYQYEDHLKSNRHKKVLEKLQREKKNKELAELEKSKELSELEKNEELSELENNKELSEELDSKLEKIEN